MYILFPVFYLLYRLQTGCKVYIVWELPGNQVLKKNFEDVRSFGTWVWKIPGNQAGIWREDLHDGIIHTL